MTDLDYSDVEVAGHPGNHSPARGAAHTTSQSQAVGRALFFLAQRILYSLLVLLAIVFLTFFGLSLAENVSLGTALQEAAAETADYIASLSQLDLGLSTAASSGVNPLPVGQVVVERMSRSLGLLGISLLLASIIGVATGMRAARSGSSRSLGLILATIIGVSVPSFFAAFLLQWAVTTYTRWAGQAILPVGGFGWDSHLILPVLVLAARPLAQITRISFVTLQEVLSKDYVRTARAKGLRGHQITWSHVLRNAAIPILTTITVSFRFALSSLPVVELYFGWPGAGYTLLKSIAQEDDTLTVTLILLFGLLIVLVNLLMEFVYRLVDPRLWEPAPHVLARAPGRVGDSLRSLGESVRELLRDYSPKAWWQRRHEAAEPSPFLALLRRSQDKIGDSGEQFVGKRSVWTAARRNAPFTVGGLLVLGLLLLIVFGTQLAPHNPYSTVGLQTVDGQLTTPPFPPGETFPWGTDNLGRDIQSLVFAGAQQTLVLVILVVAVRFVLGIFFGSIAGWNKESRWDRLILAVAEVLASFPVLLLAMILILAVGIRQGMSTFLIVLGLIGWGEIMQFVRSRVIELRGEQFVESAIASGARIPRIINTHIMPNLFGSLISLIALEMGAVLMLLGELGFISIFIGGGSVVQLPGLDIAHYSDVPEWGSLLSNIRYQARSYPWTGLYPMLAFFVAIFAFNLFGEGIRRAVESGHLIVSRFVNRYTIAVVVLAVLGYNWYQANGGATPFYRAESALFAGEEAMGHVQALTEPAMSGRSLGTEGPERAAQYIADRFAAYGLQPAGEKGTYFQERKHTFERLKGIPSLDLNDGGPSLVYNEDFAAYAGRVASIGSFEGPVRFVALGPPLRASSGFRSSYFELDRADFADEVVLTLSERDADLMWMARAGGILVVTDDPDKLDKSFTLSGRSGADLNMFTGARSGEEKPSLWISEETANRLLARSGLTVSDLRKQVENLPPESLFEQPLAATVSLEVPGVIEEPQPVKHVIGYLPGGFSYEGCQDCLDREMIVVMAQYDSPPPAPVGVTSPAANDNASGVAVMLEAIRVLNEADYVPRRSYLFVAYSGEGLDGGETVADPHIKRFLQARTGFITTFEPQAIIKLRGLGAGAGERLEVAASGSLRLAELFERSAAQMDVDTVRAEEAIDISLVYEEGYSGGAGEQSAPVVRLSWEGWEDNARTAADVPASIAPETLEQAGRTLAMALMALGREVTY